MQKFQVAYIGLNSLFGKITSLLLKQSPCIKCLKLYDDSNIWPAIDVSDINTSCKVKAFLGKDQLNNALSDVDVVIIGDEGTEKAVNPDRIFVDAADKIISYANAISRFAPGAIIILAASPLNYLLPILTKVLADGGSFNYNRILGSTAVDNICATNILAQHLKIDPKFVTLPVIGGSSEGTRVPVLSHAKPKCKLSEEVQRGIIRDIKRRETIIFEAKGIRDTIDRAYGNAKFLNSVLAGLRGEPNIIEIAMCKTDVIRGVEYFSLPLVLGKKGITKRFSIPKINQAEEAMLSNAIIALKRDCKKAISYVQEKFELTNEGNCIENNKRNFSNLFDRNVKKNDTFRKHNYENGLESANKINKKSVIDYEDNSLTSSSYEVYSPNDSFVNISSDNEPFNNDYFSGKNVSDSNEERDYTGRLEPFLVSAAENKNNDMLVKESYKHIPLMTMFRETNPGNRKNMSYEEPNFKPSTDTILTKITNNYNSKKAESLNKITSFRSEKSIKKADKHKNLTKRKDSPIKRNKHEIEAVKATEGFQTSIDPISLGNLIKSKATESNKPLKFAKSNFSVKNNISNLAIVSSTARAILQPNLHKMRVNYTNDSKAFIDRFKDRNVTEKDKNLAKVNEFENYKQKIPQTSSIFYSNKSFKEFRNSNIIERTTSSNGAVKKDEEGIERNQMANADNKKIENVRKNVLACSEESILTRNEDTKIQNLVEKASEKEKQLQVKSKKESNILEQSNLETSKSNVATTTENPISESQKSTPIIEGQSETNISTKLNEKISVRTISEDCAQQRNNDSQNGNEKDPNGKYCLDAVKKLENQQEKIHSENKSDLNTCADKVLSNTMKQNIFRKGRSTNNFLPIRDTFLNLSGKSDISNSFSKGKAKNSFEKPKNNGMKLIDMLYHSDKFKKEQKPQKSYNKLSLLNSELEPAKHTEKIEISDEQDLLMKGGNESLEIFKLKSLNKIASLNTPVQDLQEVSNKRTKNATFKSLKTDLQKISPSNKLAVNDTTKNELSNESSEKQKRINSLSKQHSVKQNNNLIQNQGTEKCIAEPVSSKTFSYKKFTPSNRSNNKHVLNNKSKTSVKEKKIQDFCKIIPESANKPSKKILENMKTSKSKRIMNMKTKHNQSLSEESLSLYVEEAVCYKPFLHSIRSSTSKMIPPGGIKYFKKPTKNKFDLLSAKMQNSVNHIKLNKTIQSSNGGRVKNDESSRVKTIKLENCLADSYSREMSYAEAIGQTALNTANVQFKSSEIVNNNSITPYKMLNEKCSKISNYHQNESSLSFMKNPENDKIIITNKITNLSNSNITPQISVNYYKNRQNPSNQLFPKKNLQPPTLYQNLAKRKTSLKNLIDTYNIASKIGTKIIYNKKVRNKKQSKKSNNENEKTLNSEINTKKENSTDKIFDDKITNNLFNKLYTSADGTLRNQPNLLAKIDSNKLFKNNQCESCTVNAISGIQFPNEQGTQNNWVFDNIPHNEYNKYNNFPSLQQFLK